MLLALQLAPLPAGWIGRLAPRTADLLPLWSGTASPGELGVWNTLSLAPQATRLALAMLLAYAVLFVTVMQRLRREADVVRLVKWIGISSGVMAAIGLLQHIVPNGKFLWVYEHPSRDAGERLSGAFANSNHFAHFLSLGAPALAAFATQVFTPGRPLLEAAIALMHLVHQQFEYLPHSTTVATAALQALAQRQGVCQDFAHVMIGALRSLGLAARYVSGYLLTQPVPGAPRLVGADASHAWVAVWCPVLGWVALDPTNAVPAGVDHVSVAWGRDYGDVAPLRGVIRGGGNALPRVGVTVQPLEPEEG